MEVKSRAEISALFQKDSTPKRLWFTGVEATLWKMDKNGTEIDPEKNEVIQDLRYF